MSFGLNNMKQVLLVISVLLMICSSGSCQDHPGDWYVKEHYKTGKMKEEGWLLKKSKTAYWYHYYPNGRVKTEGHYTKDKKTGFWTEYYATGEVKCKGSYQEGKPLGWWKYFHENGQTKCEVYYKDTMKNNWYKTFDTSGNLLEVGLYKNSSKDYFWKYFKDGRLIKKEEWKEGKLLWTTTLRYEKSDFGLFDYYKEGNLAATGTFIIRDGIITYYREDGNVYWQQGLD